MDTNIDEIAKIVTLAKPIIEPFISTIIQPHIVKLSKFLKKQEFENKPLDSFFENKFSDYLSITLNKCENINLLIFQNQQIKIDDIYYPLTIKSTKNEDRYKIIGFNSDLFEKIEKVLISDTAGMGKSTLSKWLCKKAIEENGAIPILIELRNLSENYTILDEIYSQFNPIDQDFDKDLILKFIELGNFLIILDGFDEIQLKNQEVIIKDIREFINKAKDNWYLLTSRPEGALSAFGDFQHFNIEELKNNEPFDLIRKYDSVAPVKISENLIRDIEEKYDQVMALLGNPFLVSLLYSTYTFNKDIPSSKLSFYEEIYSALYKKHDLSKDGWTRPKKSNLDIQQFRVVLRQLAFDTTLLGETNYSETKLLKLVTDAINKSPGVSANPDNFIEDIVSTVPLFQRDGLKIKWAHKSIQDFFTSEYIVYDIRKENFLNAIYDADIESYNNILEFIIESDFKTFRNTILKRLLTDYISYYDNSYKKIDFNDIADSELAARKAKSFGVYYFFKIDQNEGFEDLLMAIETKNPNAKKYKNKGIYFYGGNFLIIAAAGLKISVLEMLVNRIPQIINESDDNQQLKLPLQKGMLYEISDDPGLFLNSRKFFKKTTMSLPYTGSGTKRYKFPTINYAEAKKELEIINRDIIELNTNSLVNLLGD